VCRAGAQAVAAAAARGGGGVTWLAAPRRGAFRSRKRALDPLDAGHVTAANWGYGVVRGS
jgi:hypothetical protein